MCYQLCFGVQLARKGGHNFEVLEYDDQFSVKIDDVNHACKVINITSTTIVCVYNIYEESEDAAHTVDVVMGNETFRLGTLKLVSESGQASSHTGTIAGVIIAVFVITLIVVGAFFYYKRRQPNERTPGYLPSTTTSTAKMPEDEGTLQKNTP
ncbi:hypothetical protein ISCGN_012901 [Ixodes scapularis]